ncbi:peptidoglycan-binding protein [Ancylobacter terrae]|uniref:peptidoglycan-binding protein n=1 Tax=Ancylobacter sp. sgz301288 TaxID=3342077 RepID=UPI00385FA8AD
MLNATVLKRLYPNADDANIAAFADQSGTLLPRFGISDQRNRLHFFLAQLGHESGGLKVRTENLNYSAARLRQVWPSRFPTLASTNGFANNPKALANKVYNGRMGNRAGSDDGWNYRGRGYIQITGRDGYREVGGRAGLDLVAKPDLAADPMQALLVACAVWDWKKVNPAADAGDFTKATKLINGGTVGLRDRFEWLDKVQSIVTWPLGGVPVPESAEVALPLARRKSLQTALKDLGVYAGSIDGVIGTNTRKGLKIVQAEHGLPKNGLVTAETLAALGV